MLVLNLLSPSQIHAISKPDKIIKPDWIRFTKIHRDTICQFSGIFLDVSCMSMLTNTLYCCQKTAPDLVQDNICFNISDGKKLSAYMSKVKPTVSHEILPSPELPTRSISTVLRAMGRALLFSLVTTPSTLWTQRGDNSDIHRGDNSHAKGR